MHIDFVIENVIEMTKNVSLQLHKLKTFSYNFELLHTAKKL